VHKDSKAHGGTCVLWGSSKDGGAEDRFDARRTANPASELPQPGIWFPSSPKRTTAAPFSRFNSTNGRASCTLDCQSVQIAYGSPATVWRCFLTVACHLVGWRKQMLPRSMQVEPPLLRSARSCLQETCRRLCCVDCSLRASLPRKGGLQILASEDAGKGAN
jgi:hypothetical protein